jgi:hypothetical protein
VGDWQLIDENTPKGVKIIGGYWNVLGNWRSIMACYYPPGTLQADESLYDDPNYADESGYAPEGWYEESETHDNIMRCETLTHWQPCPKGPAK